MLIEDDSKHRYPDGENTTSGTRWAPLIRTIPAPPPSLTVRQRQILWLASQGKTNQEIGQELFIATDTVKTVMRHIAKRTGADNRCHAVAIAMRCDLFSRVRPPTNRPDCVHITWAEPADRPGVAERRTIAVADQGHGAWSVRHCGRWLSTRNTWDRHRGNWRPPDWLDTHTFLYSNAIEIAQRTARHLMMQEP